jgi:hypothetical protein
MQDGHVTLSARQASLAAILAEWARVGQATIVNGDMVTATPITIELSDVSEQQALQMLLRATGGFVAVPRPAPAPGVSTFARIVIVPMTVAASTANATAARTYAPPPAVPAAVPPQPVTQTPGVTRLIGPNGLPVPDDQADGTPPGLTRLPGNVAAGDAPPRSIPPATVPPTPPTRVPSGTIGAAAPGVITPAPQAPPPSPIPSGTPTPQR